MIVIGFTGPPGAGKDTAYLILEHLLKDEWSVARYSFADPLREFADQLMDLPEGHDLWGPKHKDQMLEAFNTRTPRELLIDLGMLGRKYRPDIWLDKAIDKILDEQPEVAVITDVRFRNEAAKVRALGGHLVEIQRDGLDYNPDLESESGQAKPFVTHRVANKGPIQSFQHAVEDFWWRLIAERSSS